MNELMEAISTVGFPIACCAFMFWQNHQMSEKHSAETKGFIEAITKNTEAIEDLREIIKRGGEKNG